MEHACSWHGEAGGVLVPWRVRARGTWRVCVDARRRSGAGRAHARGRCGAGAQACGRGAAWPSRLGTPSAVCAGGAARPGWRACTRPSGCCGPGWGAWPCAGKARVSQPGHGVRAGSAWHGCARGQVVSRRTVRARAGGNRGGVCVHGAGGGREASGARRVWPSDGAASGLRGSGAGGRGTAAPQRAGQGRQWCVRPALIAVGGRAMRRWRGKRERARYDRRKRKGDIDEWNRESGIGCSGQRKDF